MKWIGRISVMGACSWMFALGGCALHEPYGNDRTPVDVRRGESYDKPVYEQRPYGRRPAPQINRPVYPAQGHASETDKHQHSEQQSRQSGHQSVPAVQRLVTRAREHNRNEDYRQAAVSAESALRLDPQSVDAYEALALTHLYERRYSESEQMALRAISILRGRGVASNNQQLRDFWMLIAETRRKRGDNQGAERAVQQAGGRF